MLEKRWRALQVLGLVVCSASTLIASAQSPKRQFTAGTLEAAGKPITLETKGARQAKGRVSVIVKFDTDSVAEAAGLESQNGAIRRLDMKSAQASKQLSTLATRRRSFEAAARLSVPSARIVHDLSVVVGGVSMVVDEDQIETLRRMPGVKRVYRDTLQHLTTDRSPHFIGANQLWAVGSEGRGEGVVVGVLDSGVWPEHPSFSDPDPNGKTYPAPPASWHGAPCQFGSTTPGDAPFTCNNKLLGARRFLSTYDALVGLTPAEFNSARDDDGHGTHTSSTAAGNNNVAASIFGIPRGKVSGIAPRAHVVMYKVCGLDGCFGSDTAAAVQQAIVDGVDVINFSISGGANPYSDVTSLAFLDAYNAGVFVAASAGNSGPAADTTDHREPWVTTVAASTQARQFISTLTLKGSDGKRLTVTGASITPGLSAFTPVVNAASAPYNDALCQNGTADGAFAGKVVLCQRGVNARVAKGFNVKQRGAVGMILYNPVLGGLSTDNHFLPAVQLEVTDGAKVLSFFSAHSGVAAAFTQGTAAPGQGDVMAAFSSRGGPGQTLGISKPDVTAPGVQILAGHTPLSASTDTGPQGELFQAIAGTSMSSPHVAGAAALLIGLHPDWTPGQVKSALMLTSKRTVLKEDGKTLSDPFDRGSGRIQVADADNPGISISASGADFIAQQANLSIANYPSLYVPSHPGVVTVQRTVHSELWAKRKWTVTPGFPADVKVTVTPATFTLPPGGNQTLTITVDASTVPQGQVRFASLHLVSGPYAAHFPISLVRGTSPLAFSKTCAPEKLKLNTDTTCAISVANTSFEPAATTVTDLLPSQLRLSSVTGATMVDARNLSFSGTLAGASPPDVSTTNIPGTAPAGGYLPLSAFGIEPISGFGDETLINFSVPAFVYGSEQYTLLGVVSNGYLVVGGGTNGDVDYINQTFPDATPPNNVLAPFWTDLNPGAGGAIRIATLTDGVNTWLVVDFDSVKNYSSATTHSFEVWIGINGTEDITYVYGNSAPGDGGFATVGAENKFGNRGANYFVDGSGTLPDTATELRVSTSPPVAGETKTITFTARGVSKGKWTNCARATAPEIFFGTAAACFSGEVTK